jgi:hypothetical protein
MWLTGGQRPPARCSLRWALRRTRPSFAAASSRCLISAVASASAKSGPATTPRCKSLPFHRLLGRCTRLVRREIVEAVHTLTLTLSLTQVHGLIFVVDSANQDAITESKNVLDEVIRHDFVTGKPIVVLVSARVWPCTLARCSMLIACRQTSRTWRAP